MTRLVVPEDIRDARLPPAALYADPAWQADLRDRVLARSWHLLADPLPPPGHARADTLLPGVLDEPILLTHPSDGPPRALSNACTHRGHLLLDPGPARPLRQLRCGYHGRRFDLGGACAASPGFAPEALEDAALPTLGLGEALGLAFAAVAPAQPFAAWWAQVEAAVGPIDGGALDPAGSVDHTIPVHWALYVENYLEGLHIPFVHPALAGAVDLAAYQTELVPGGVLQLGFAPGGGPGGVRLADGRDVAAAWLWLFPGTMVNVYPWGVSVNGVLPAGPSATVVRYRTIVTRPELRGEGAGADLGQVEREDQEAVRRVAAGQRARAWRPGRYAPEHERGVHHFHRMLAGA